MPTKHGANAWIAAGGALLTVGLGSAAILATVASTSEKEAGLWHRDWFLALIALCALLAVFGLYGIFAQVFPELPFWREPPPPRKGMTVAEFLRPRPQTERPARDLPADEPEPSPLHFAVRYLIEGELVVGIGNRGPTISDAKLNILAPKRHERQWMYRKDRTNAVAQTGTTDELGHELVPGLPTSLRWSETHLELHGYSTTELRFFLPRFAGDPIHVRIGSDALHGWDERVFMTPSDDEMRLEDLTTGFRFTYASYGIGDKIIDPINRLNARIKDGRINFIVDNATMGDDPAPDQLKKLIVRWRSKGKEFSSSFTEGTHVGLPD